MTLIDRTKLEYTLGRQHSKNHVWSNIHIWVGSYGNGKLIELNQIESIPVICAGDDEDDDDAHY